MAAIHIAAILATAGMILLWDVDSGLAQINKYFHSNDNHVNAGALLGVRIVNCGIKNDCGPALALLGDCTHRKDTSIRIGAIMGLGIAYAGSQNEQHFKVKSKSVIKAKEISKDRKTPQSHTSNLANVCLIVLLTESELVKKIVGDVLRKLTPSYRNQLKGLVGIEDSCEEIESVLKIGSTEVITIGIWGMGGIGKTTLATTLYARLSPWFEGCCFLENVRENSSSHNRLEALRNKLFAKLLQIENHCFDPNFVRRKLKHKKVFIVLDDVVTLQQLEYLIEDYDFLGPGSRVIVTTRDKQIFNLVDEVYKVKELSSDQSLQLLCLTVFGEKQPKHGYEDLSRSVVSYCKGVPLALKVLGASLRRRSEEVWESELGKLQKIPNMQIHNILKLSYDGLDHSQKNIYLDIACLLKGERRDLVTSLLEACGFFAISGIEVLLDKALITISNYNEIEMHDLIQQMGQEIVHQESIKDPGRRSRLWKHDEVYEVLKYNKGTYDVEGIILNLDTLTEDLCLSFDCLAKMANVRFLKIHKVRYWDEYKFNLYLPHGLKSLSNKLRYLRWDGFCLESLPSNFCAEQLVELHISLSKVKRLWDGVQDLSNLKTIRLHDLPELIEIPDLSMARKLEHISLMDCISLCELHPSIVSLPNLTEMGLFRCSRIEILKVHSKSLRILVAYDCSSLKEFSITSKEMVCLNLRKTTISALPSSIWNNRKLSDLHLTVSNNLERLSKEGGMGSITTLNHSECMKHNAWNMPFLQPLHHNFGNLSFLETLWLTGINDVSLIANIQNLSLLKLLYLLNCQKFVSLPQLPPSLRELHLSDLRELVSLPQLPSSLRVLHLSYLRELMSLPQLPPSLKYLWLDDCRKLVSLPQLPPSVTYVRAINCTFLGTDFTQRIALQHILSHSQSTDCETCFMFSGDHVTDKCEFQKAGTSITIPYLSPSNLCGFICSLVLYRGSYGGLVSCSIYQDDEEDFDYYYSVPKNLTSDHILFQYFKPEDLSNDVPFKFEFHFYDRDSDKDYGQERIKECGVFPVYASSIEIGVGASNAENELESISQINNNESQPTENGDAVGVGVGGSNN
ncbi:disease resistance protein RPP2A [Cajanus cajan]|uniref:disease resistance protein RPP2A n=1 Tax=Cajanus cajan TaxID=3821 RepID=UPI00098D87AA|nr:disease resistance protein RPP2A [Cajanus cajan]